MSMGSHLHFRSLRPGEDSVVRDLFARLSLPTRYLRFFLPLPVLSDSLLRIIGGAEDQGRIAMVAETDDVRRQVVALGNVVVSRQPIESIRRKAADHARDTIPRSMNGC